MLEKPPNTWKIEDLKKRVSPLHARDVTHLEKAVPDWVNFAVLLRWQENLTPRREAHIGRNDDDSQRHNTKVILLIHIPNEEN